jgi:hypothetical protein
MWDNFVISKKTLKAINRTMGENSPYLVTLILDKQEDLFVGPV